MKNEYTEYKKFKDMVYRVRMASLLSNQEKIDYFKFFYDINGTADYTRSDTEDLYYSDNNFDTFHYDKQINNLDLSSLGVHHFLSCYRGKPVKINRHYFVGKRNDIPYRKASLNFITDPKTVFIS